MLCVLTAGQCKSHVTLSVSDLWAEAGAYSAVCQRTRLRMRVCWVVMGQCCVSEDETEDVCMLSGHGSVLCVRGRDWGCVYVEWSWVSAVCQRTRLRMCVCWVVMGQCCVSEDETEDACMLSGHGSVLCVRGRDWGCVYVEWSWVSAVCQRTRLRMLVCWVVMGQCCVSEDETEDACMLSGHGSVLCVRGRDWGCVYVEWSWVSAVCQRTRLRMCVCWVVMGQCCVSEDETEDVCMLSGHGSVLCVRGRDWGCVYVEWSWVSAVCQRTRLRMCVCWAVMGQCCVSEDETEDVCMLRGHGSVLCVRGRDWRCLYVEWSWVSAVCQRTRLRMRVCWVVMGQCCVSEDETEDACMLSGHGSVLCVRGRDWGCVYVEWSWVSAVCQRTRLRMRVCWVVMGQCCVSEDDTEDACMLSGHGSVLCVRGRDWGCVYVEWSWVSAVCQRTRLRMCVYWAVMGQCCVSEDETEDACMLSGHGSVLCVRGWDWGCVYVEWSWVSAVWDWGCVYVEWSWVSAVCQRTRLRMRVCWVVMGQCCVSEDETEDACMLSGHGSVLCVRGRDWGCVYVEWSWVSAVCQRTRLRMCVCWVVMGQCCVSEDETEDVCMLSGHGSVLCVRGRDWGCVYVEWSWVSAVCQRTRLRMRVCWVVMGQCCVSEDETEDACMLSGHGSVLCVRGRHWGCVYVEWSWVSAVCQRTRLRMLVCWVVMGQCCVSEDETEDACMLSGHGSVLCVRGRDWGCVYVEWSWVSAVCQRTRLRMRVCWVVMGQCCVSEDDTEDACMLSGHGSVLCVRGRDWGCVYVEWSWVSAVCQRTRLRMRVCWEVMGQCCVSEDETEDACMLRGHGSVLCVRGRDWGCVYVERSWVSAVCQRTRLRMLVCWEVMGQCCVSEDETEDACMLRGHGSVLCVRGRDWGCVYVEWSWVSAVCQRTRLRMLVCWEVMGQCCVSEDETEDACMLRGHGSVLCVRGRDWGCVYVEWSWVSAVCPRTRLRMCVCWVVMGQCCVSEDETEDACMLSGHGSVLCVRGRDWGCVYVERSWVSAVCQRTRLRMRVCWEVMGQCCVSEDETEDVCMLSGHGSVLCVRGRDWGCVYVERSWVSAVCQRTRLRMCVCWVVMGQCCVSEDETEDVCMLSGHGSVLCVRGRDWGCVYVEWSWVSAVCQRTRLRMCVCWAVMGQCCVSEDETEDACMLRGHGSVLCQRTRLRMCVCWAVMGQCCVRGRDWGCVYVEWSWVSAVFYCAIWTWQCCHGLFRHVCVSVRLWGRRELQRFIMTDNWLMWLLLFVVREENLRSLLMGRSAFYCSDSWLYPTVLKK